MTIFDESVKTLEKLFKRDYQFAFATSFGDVPSVRFVDTYLYKGAFYIVSYKKSQKAMELEKNPNCAMCNKLYRFSGKCVNVGHPLEKQNAEVRSVLIEVFKDWYFLHNNEDDENMCYLKFVPDSGFFYGDGLGYKVNFKEKTAEKFPFDFDIKII